MTKKIVSCKWLVLGVLIVLCSCVTSPTVFDETLPVEQTARIYLYPGLEVKAYNGIEVPFKTSLFGSITSEWRDVILPAGEAEFLLDVDHRVGDLYFRARNVAFRYTFEAGKHYSIVVSTSTNDEDDWGALIYDQAPQIGWPKKSNLIAFVPFYKGK